MSQTKLHKLSVKQRPDAAGKISTGANTQVFLDDKPLNGVKFLKAEFHARRLTKVLIEMYVELGEIETTVLLSQEPERSDKRSRTSEAPTPQGNESLGDGSSS
ncbi:MAG: hypothetical protein HC840_10465 [Leptolyngbyaceae cyanobacterium RM2_2_4]|nr:hypothetical protein [Leptolyngbyaceae cyanobacterium RM2_2_4]